MGEMNEDAVQILGETPPDYAGDVAPEEVWRQLQIDPDAQLVDVRTAAEWAFVGAPDLSLLNKRVVAVEWQVFPAMQRNGKFFDLVKSQLGEVGADGSGALYFLCRSGVRSMAAAQLVSAQGLSNAYNIADGFEGNRNTAGHRGTTGGWKAQGLAWVQS
ncbi:MAG: rhodanese-like domain-containing protein [Alphaproteobacteria bacterium]